MDKSEIEPEVVKYCENELGLKGQEKENMVQKCMAEIEDDQKITPSKFVDLLKIASGY